MPPAAYSSGSSARPDRAAHPAARPLGEDQREVQEERRQQQDRDRVRPVEDPVEPIEPAVEREGEGAEEREAQPEEVQRRLVARTAKPHRRADDQREDADGREHVVERGVPARQRGERDLARLARVSAAAPCSASRVAAWLLRWSDATTSSAARLARRRWRAARRRAGCRPRRPGRPARRPRQ